MLLRIQRSLQSQEIDQSNLHNSTREHKSTTHNNITFPSFNTNTMLKSTHQFEAQSAALASLPSTTTAGSPRQSWTCVMDIDSELDGPALRSCDPPSILSTSRSSCRRRSSRGSVSFASTSKLMVIERLDGYDRKQGSYTAADEAKFKKQARDEVIAFLQLKYASGTSKQQHRDMCLVGIEQYLLCPNPEHQRQRVRALVRHAVLSEQARAYAQGCVGDTSARIAEVSRQYTQQSVSQAKLIGDFQFIQCTDDH